MGPVFGILKKKRKTKRKIKNVTKTNKNTIVILTFIFALEHVGEKSKFQTCELRTLNTMYLFKNKIRKIIKQILQKN